MSSRFLGSISVAVVLLSLSSVLGIPPGELADELRAQRLGAPTEGSFASQNVTLLSWLDLPALGASSSGNDCWGYVSSTGREYALISVDNLMSVVEVTDPVNPVIVGNIPHPSCLWGDVKVYQDVAYVVTDVCANGIGIQVVDLSDVDNGNVSLIRTIGLPNRSHNVVVNEDSGYLYTVGSNGGSNVTVIYDLTDPTNPLEVGTWGTYEHDAQVVTYTSGPNAGREIMFGASEGRGLDIVDVTDKSNTFLLSRTTYPNVDYCHQVWTEDLQHLYINDELDNIPRTIVFDISNLSNPVYLGEFSSGTNAIDHNNYVLDGIVYSANYKSGLRIFDTNVDPVNPTQIGWFDTYPPDDSDGFAGAWSCYPFLPSGNILISDENRGLFVVRFDANALAITYPAGLPETVLPNTATVITTNVVGTGSPVNPATVTLHISVDGGLDAPVTMTDVGGGDFEAALPAVPCGSAVTFYVTAENSLGTPFVDPPNAPATTYSTIIGEFITILADNFESNTGWTAANLGATSGDWQRGVPVNDPGWDYDPAADSDGSGQCQLTQNQLGNTDVDSGSVRLISPILDLTGGSTSIQYDYFLRMTDSSTDLMLVEIDGNGGLGPWTEIARHDSDGGLSWRTNRIDQTDLDAAGVVTTTTMQLRFTVNDSDPQSIVEAGLDAFSILRFECVDTICVMPCSDNDPCTANDLCVGNVCAGTAVDCSGAGDQCNVASCDVAGADGNCTVLTAVTNGTACDDSAACNINETCQSGICTGGAAPDCSGAGDQCNIASCDAGGLDGNCSILTPVANGTGCDDSASCNIGETCQSGICTGGASPDCSAAGDECNTASCDSGGGEGNCDSLTPVVDGTPCGGAMNTCVGGVCQAPPCVTAADCGDVDSNGTIDDACMFYTCVSSLCNAQPRIFGDMGSAFGKCGPDTFANLADALHALTCFASTNPCDELNLDVGGAFGDCTPDGFCNLADALHALTAFAGTSVCTCPPVPAPLFTPQVVATATLSVVADRRVIQPGGEVQVHVYIDNALPDLRGYQLEVEAAGGRRGQLDLRDITIANRKARVFNGEAGDFDAFNVTNGQMLSALQGDGVATSADAYLASFVYRASPDAVGTFVVDVRRDIQTFLVATSDGKIELVGTTPAVIVVSANRAAGVR